jgi:two-component system, OmpR family, heavy metal sensor histidine kinase CusS
MRAAHPPVMAATLDAPMDGGKAAPVAPAVGTTPCTHSISARLSKHLALMTMLVLAPLFACLWWSLQYFISIKNAEDVAEHAHVISDIIALEARAGGEAAVRARIAADAPMRMNSKLELWHADGRPFFADAIDSKRVLSIYTQSAEVMIPAPGLPGLELKARYTKDFARDHDMGRRWAWILALVTLGAGAVVALGTRRQTRRQLEPLSQLAAQTRAISPQRLDQRLSLQDPPSEALPWIEQFNALMQRLDRAYAQLEGFNADVAHELRTPLATLRMQTELALSRPRTVDELRDTLTSSLEEMDRLTSLVNDMLFLSQSDRGATARRGAPLSLAALAREVIEFHEVALDESGLRVEVIGDAVLAVDESLVKRALSNLMSNATRFGERGSTVHVRIEGGPRGASLSVDNRGPGIDLAQMPRLFDRFFRADVSRCCDDGVSHYGLGLAIVAAIARMHGGEPSATSGNGLTRIGFTLGV